MFLDIKAAITNVRVQLVIAFCILVLLKILLSLRFHSPWIFPDEAIYANMAADISGSAHQNLPPAYPFVISIAYLFSENKIDVYHMVLLINSLLSSLIIFPSYFILNKYCPDDFSFMGAITIATLPAVTLYSFVIMTENLFIPLFMFSLWFLLEAYEKRNLFWIFLAVASAFLLFFSRHNGIFMLVAMAISLAYYLLSGRRSAEHFPRLNKRMTSIIFIILVVASFASMKLLFTLSERNSYLNWLHERITSDSQLLLLLATDINNLHDYLSLLQNEIAYLMISSYFIFFYISILFLSGVFLIGVRDGKWSPISGFFNSSRRIELIALKSGGVYFISASIILLFLITISLYKFEQEIYGRYIDPIIPGLFLYGLAGLYQMHRAKEHPPIKMLSFIGIIFTMVFCLSFPVLKAEEFPLLYVNPLRNLAPNWIIFPALSALFFLLLSVYKNLKDKWKIFFIIIIGVSVCISAYSYYADLLYQSDRYHAMNQIGMYLNENSSKGSLVIMDDEIAKNDWHFDSLTSFWAKTDLQYMPVNEDLILPLDGEVNDIYIITSKALPLDPLAHSSKGYHLYNLY